MRVAVSVLFGVFSEKQNKFVVGQVFSRTTIIVAPDNCGLDDAVERFIHASLIDLDCDLHLRVLPGYKPAVSIICAEQLVICPISHTIHIIEQ